MSWFSDYQARRANVRYRPAGGKGTEICHTLNGSALAVPRVWAALSRPTASPTARSGSRTCCGRTSRRHRHLVTRGGVRYLDVVVPPVGEEPRDIGTGHPMREITELVARDPSAWTPALAERVAGFFDELAPQWQAETSARSQVALGDLLACVDGLRSPVVEVGAGTGAGTAALAARFDHVVAGDLSSEMLTRFPATLASRVRLDGSQLPFADGSVATLVCVNMFLFADEVHRVLAADGSLVWVNSIGVCTPIHLSAERVAEVLGAEFEVVVSRAGWGTWAVASRRPPSAPRPPHAPERTRVDPS